MKIENIPNPASPSPGGNPGKPSAPGTAFGDILLQRIDSPAPAGQTVSPGSLSELQAEMPVGAVETPSDGPSASIARLQQTLDLLDSYAKDIGDGTKSLKSIEPTLASLVREADATGQTLSGTSDPRLVELVQQIRLAAGLEQFRFARGDYVDK